MKIGIFGGSFNPPHKMHVSICNTLIKNKYVDKIVFVPTGSKYKYKNNLISDRYRYDMLKLIVKHNEYLCVSDYELKNKLVYTYQTLDYFKNKYKDDEIYFICGLDNLSYMDKWEHGEYILSNFKIIVINRNTSKIDEVMKKLNKYSKNITFVDDFKKNFIKDISSTVIRKKLQNGEDVSPYLDDEVISYIRKENLYACKD